MVSRQPGDHLRATGYSQRSQGAIAARLRGDFGLLEARQRNPNLDLMARLAVALDIDLGTLVQVLQEKRGRS